MKSLQTVGVALALAAQPAAVAAQDVPEFNPQVVRILAEGCRPGEMFTVDTTKPYDGGGLRQLSSAVAPLQTLGVTATSRSRTVTGVELWAAQPDDAGTVDERKAYATALFDVVDAAVFEAGLFGQRVWDQDKEAVVYSSPVADPESKVVLELSQLGVSFIAGCVDESKAQLAMDEFLGRTRVERPIRPVLPTPERVRLTECDEPTRAEAIYDNFESGGSSDVLNIGTAANAYFEHLVQWYGQELMDKGVWTQEKRDAFRMSMLNDRVIMRGMEQQLARLQPLLGLTMEMIERREAADSVGSCRVVVQLTDLLSEMSQANEVQWNRAAALYKAEAARLRVTLED